MKYDNSTVYFTTFLLMTTLNPDENDAKEDRKVVEEELGEVKGMLQKSFSK